MVSGKRRAAVIGSGFGGLAVAIRLAAAGFETTIFEARDQPGGRAYVYREQGYTFDAGPTVITAPPCLEALFEISGRRMADYVELLPVTPFYRLIWPDGDQLEYTSDVDQMVAQIGRRSSADAAGYRRFIEYSRAVFDVGYTDLVATPFLRFRDMVQVAPDLIRLRADRSVYDAVSRFVRDEHVRQALSFHSLLVGGNPFETSAIYTLIHHLERKWGLFFPRGGTGKLIGALARLFAELGGELRLDSPVERVEVEGAGISARHLVTAGGKTEPFNLVVSNADLHHTYGSIYRGVAGAAQMRRRVERMEWSMSLFVLYFGTDRPYTDAVVHHTVLFGARYRELLAEVFHGHSLPRDFSLYLHAPTVTDPSLAPPGCGTFYVLAPVPHLGNAPVDWEQLAPAYAARILEALEAVLPDLRRRVVVQRALTPQGFASDLRSHHGSAFSVAPRLTQSAWFRPHNRDPRIPNLYLVGAGTHPGAGVPGVVNSALATARTIGLDFGVEALR